MVGTREDDRLVFQRPFSRCFSRCFSRPLSRSLSRCFSNTLFQIPWCETLDGILMIRCMYAVTIPSLSYSFLDIYNNSIYAVEFYIDLGRDLGRVDGRVDTIVGSIVLSNISTDRPLKHFHRSSSQTFPQIVLSTFHKKISIKP